MCLRLHERPPVSSSASIIYLYSHLPSQLYSQISHILAFGFRMHQLYNSSQVFDMSLHRLDVTFFSLFLSSSSSSSSTLFFSLPFLQQCQYNSTTRIQYGNSSYIRRRLLFVHLAAYFVFNDISCITFATDDFN